MGDMRLGKTAWSAGGGTKFSQVQLFSLYAAQQRTARILTADTKIDRIAASDRSWPVPADLRTAAFGREVAIEALYAIG
ncbi:MAG: hypothetical protein ACJ8R9_26405 [Steroidobacteraceae bacterium]